MFNELRKAYKPEIATQFTSERAQFQLEQLNKTIENGHTEARRAYWANLSDMGLDSEIRMDEFGRAYIPDAILALLPTKEMARFIELCTRYNQCCDDLIGKRQGSKAHDALVELKGEILAELKMFEPTFKVELEFEGGKKLKVPQPGFKLQRHQEERTANKLNDMYHEVARLKSSIKAKSEWLRQNLERLEASLNDERSYGVACEFKSSLYPDLIDETGKLDTLTRVLHGLDPQKKWADSKALAEFYFE